ncbi:hypothetical protein [Bradyrhizobium japonicum]|uniref:hypothetical protein n=1 Tax=Bradyrhizobium japonicum TaxID=375 RepID=UPI001BA9BCD9|nr:hypothetical protein [Bradyrhizobium japonicum]MBR0960896.1 hypothetical protein [Bradyrhizobium japonicum]
MDVHTKQHRRPRNNPRKTSGIVVRTMHDAKGIAEPLVRYGELLACQIVGLYNAIHGLSVTSDHCRARLGRLFHEAEGLPASGKLLTRPTYQWRYGYNHQTIYRVAPGAGRLLIGNGLCDAQMLRWSAATRIVHMQEDAEREPSDHDAALSFVVSSIEIGVRRTPGLLFVTHLDVVRNASPAAQSASSPFAIPISELSHMFPAGHHATLRDIHLKPDAIFGIQYPPADDPEFVFFAVEYDRSTEDVEPSRNLARASWLRKVLSYSAISTGRSPIYESHLKVPSLLVLCIFSDPQRTAHVMDLVQRCAMDKSQFLFKTVPPVDPLLVSAPMPTLFTDPWQGIRGPRKLTTIERR